MYSISQVLKGMSNETQQDVSLWRCQKSSAARRKKRVLPIQAPRFELMRAMIPT